MTGRPAVLLDRDGTLTEPRHHPSRPDDLILRPGVGEPLRSLNALGVALVVVTNQSGMARGLFGRTQLDAMHQRLTELLTGQGVILAGILDCPHHPDGVVPELSVVCACRKPAPGMLLRAARQHGLDLRSSWMVGDFDSDVEAGRRAGCRTALVRADTAEGHGPPPAGPPEFRAASTERVLSHILGWYRAGERP
ncbi:D-glycero-alpha-D-manno-heptose-1,7-bisphosphate 7-phosphatase [Streptomyces prasinopilosus]|uniref:D,D-heptose 1,7-bisphosphate phosphatase n=1 Tax=Streptomyces prasinopilosus TaxID=67344 RepID=A0A1G6M326_9ACTN|nr:HAD family hydrolase [Streptomyces prasinopilosus]SDC49714.1 D-glycero-D-manno-heptose 1,7-bisphosphate phosphatase [Streptomyces prasinopilosus]